MELDDSFVTTQTLPAPSVAVPVSAALGLPLAAAGVTMTLWASAFIAIRPVGVYYSPGAMAAGRLLVGARRARPGRRVSAARCGAAGPVVGW